MFRKKFNKGDVNFYADEKCNSCEVCEKVCPVNNIKIIDGNRLCDLLGRTGLIGFLDIIEWIQKEKVNSKTNLIKKEKKRQEIIKYITSYDGIPNKNTIEKNFKIDMRTYFTNIKNFNRLIKEIKSKSNNDNVQAYKGLQ